MKPVAPQLRDPQWLREKIAHHKISEIAEELGCTTSTVYKAMHSHQIPLRYDGVRKDRYQLKVPITKEQLEEAYERYPSWERLAKHLGISKSAARNYANRLGVDRERLWLDRNRKRTAKTEEKLAKLTLEQMRKAKAILERNRRVVEEVLNGATLTAAAQKHGVDIGFASRILSGAGFFYHSKYGWIDAKQAEEILQQLEMEAARVAT